MGFRTPIIKPIQKNDSEVYALPLFFLHFFQVEKWSRMAKATKTEPCGNRNEVLPPRSDLNFCLIAQTLNALEGRLVKTITK